MQVSSLSSIELSILSLLSLKKDGYIDRNHELGEHDRTLEEHDRVRRPKTLARSIS